MPRQCECSRKCKHIVKGSGDPLLEPEELARLESVLPLLVDAADAFDSESLTFDPDCGVHGTRRISNEECICRGTRYSASEFVSALQLDIRSRSTRYSYPTGQPNRLRDGLLRLAPTG